VGLIRIIAGEFRGRRIKVLDASAVRPTADRVREALFNILGDRVPGAKVLDAYSGSGALGFEALSRGAGEAVFVESDREALAALAENAATLGISSLCTIIPAEFSSFLAGAAPDEPFDLVLADPPYAAGEAERFLPIVSAPQWLGRDGLIVVERDRKDPAVEVAGHGVVLARTARYGSTCLDLYRR
jgi:16S rRNA (guanine966-N2)-methyltransferase